MADFKVHPVLRSPAVAGLSVAGAAMVIFDAGFADYLSRIGETPLTAEDWNGLSEVRWALALLTGFFGWAAWAIVNFSGKVEIKVPAVGIMVGVGGLLFAPSVLLALHHAVNDPEIAAAQPVVGNISVVWSVLAVMVGTGCGRLGLRSYRILRGGA